MHQESLISLCCRDFLRLSVVGISAIPVYFDRAAKLEISQSEVFRAIINLAEAWYPGSDTVARLWKHFQTVVPV